MTRAPPLGYVNVPHLSEQIFSVFHFCHRHSTDELCTSGYRLNCELVLIYYQTFVTAETQSSVLVIAVPKPVFLPQH